MKRETSVQAPRVGGCDDGSVTDMSEAALHRQVAELGEWLAARGLDLRREHAHAGEGSRDRLYWRYGYFFGLKQALAELTNRGAALH